MDISALLASPQDLLAARSTASSSALPRTYILATRYTAGDFIHPAPRRDQTHYSLPLTTADGAPSVQWVLENFYDEATSGSTCELNLGRDDCYLQSRRADKSYSLAPTLALRPSTTNSDRVDCVLTATVRTANGAEISELSAEDHDELQEVETRWEMAVGSFQREHLGNRLTAEELYRQLRTAADILQRGTSVVQGGPSRFEIVQHPGRSPLTSTILSRPRPV